MTPGNGLSTVSAWRRRSLAPDWSESRHLTGFPKMRRNNSRPALPHSWSSDHLPPRQRHDVTRLTHGPYHAPADLTVPRFCQDYIRLSPPAEYLPDFDWACIDEPLR